MVKQLKKKRSNNSTGNITWHIKGLHTLGESLHKRLFRVPIYGKGVNAGLILSGQIITSRTIIIIDNVPRQIVVGVGIYEVGKPAVFDARGDSCISVNEYYKTVKPKSSLKLSSDKSINMWPFLKPRIVTKCDTSTLINKASRMRIKCKDAKIVKIDMVCIKVPSEQYANPLFTLVVTQPNKCERLPLYYLTLPIYNPSLEYKGIEGEAKLSTSFSQLFDYLWPYSDTPRMKKKAYNEYLKELGSLGQTWLNDNTTVSVERINNLCMKLNKHSTKKIVIAELLEQILGSLLVEMRKKGVMQKCANTDCSKYFNEKGLKKYCSVACNKHAHYLDNRKKGLYSKVNHLNKKRQYMRDVIPT